MKKYFRELSVVGALVAVLIGLAIFAPAFFQPQPLLSLVTREAPTLVVACGMALVIIARQIDISVGSQFSVCSVCAGLLAARGWPLALVIPASALLGAGLGAINGVLVAGLRLPSIVVTLATMVTLRQGLKVHFQIELQGFDGPDLAGRIFEIVRKESPISCIVYDAIGNGADLDSALRRMPGLPHLIAVQWGQPATDSKQYFNQRSECWGKMRDFLEHGQIPDQDDLSDQLTSLDYGYSATFQIQLQSKKDQKKNGGKSPDKADSLALSFIPELITTRLVVAKVRPVNRRSVILTRT